MKKVLIIHPEGNINNNPNLTGIVEILCENGYKVDICSLRRSNIYQYSWCAGASLFLLDRPENLVENGTFILEDPKLNSQEKIISYINENFKSYDLAIGVDRGIIEAALIAQNRQIPCGLISYEIFFEEETSREFKQKEIEACKCLDFIVCQDELRAKYLSIENKIALEKIINIPVAGRGIKKGEKNSYLYDSLGIDKDKKIALLMGSVAQWSMADYILESAKLWSEDWVLVVHSRYGFDQHVRPYYEKYKHFDNIYFSLEPVANPNKMHRIIHSADVGLAFYKPLENNIWASNNIRFLGMASGKIATYLQHGLPIIINEIGRMSEHVREYELGLVIDDKRNFDISLTTAELLRFRKNCSDYYEKILDLNRRIAPLLKIMRNLLGGHVVNVPSEGSLAPNMLESLFEKRPGADDFDDFTYSKKSHFSLFKGYDVELYGKSIDPDACDLKAYQDLLVFSFIKENIPRGSRILDIGGGKSRILNYFKNNYECWNLDKLEGLGNGPVAVGSEGCRLVKDYIGCFNKELPDNYFDFVFSISALEHVPEDDEDYFKNIRDDISRILKPGGYSLHCFDVVMEQDSVWTNKLLPFLFKNLETAHPFIPLEELDKDSDLYCMSKQAYSRHWEHTTKRTYEAFGKPLSYNIMWKKALKFTPIIGKSKQEDKHSLPKISVITPSYNQAEFLVECIESILSQNYPNLEYIIMDGGSTDGSVETIKKYAKYLTYWQSRPDGGQYAAISEGFKRTSGRIMTWLNSDDKHHPDSLFKAAYIFEKYPTIEWITGRPTFWDQYGHLESICPYLPLWKREKYLLKGGEKKFIQQESTFWTATLWKKAGAKLKTDLKFAGDFELWLRFFRYAQLFTVDTLFGGFRHQPKQKINLFLDQYFQEADSVIDQEIINIEKGIMPHMLPAPEPIPFDYKEFQRSKKNIVAAVNNTNYEKTQVALYNNIGKACLQKGELANALKNFTKALKIDPYDLATVLNCGQVLTSHGKFEEAGKLYRAYLQENPNDNKVIHALESLNCEKRIEGWDDVIPGYKKDLIARAEHVAMQQNQVDVESRKYLVSAIVSMYNSQRFIRGCLEDLENQTISDRLEIIVVNSGSEQNEEAIVKEFQQKYDNIKYIRTDQRETVYQAWNRGIKAAAGKYITNANTDDRLREDAYERKIQILENNPHVGVIYADQWISQIPNEKFDDCKKEQGLIWPEFFPELDISFYIVGSQPMWRRDLHEEYGLFDESLESAGDFDFWARVSRKTRFYHIPDFLGVHYHNPPKKEQCCGYNTEQAKQIVQRYKRNREIPAREQSLFSNLTSVFHKIKIFRNQAKIARHRSTVSVVVPMYNSSEYIIETLKSILKQTADNFEIIVIDDGNVDDSLEKVIRCLEKTNIPVTVLSIPNRGTAIARNIAVFYSTGEFILPFDSDDIMMPEMIADFYKKLLSDSRLGFCYCDLEYFGDKQEIRSMDYPNANNFMWKNQAHACSMFRKAAWIDASGYHSRMEYGDADWDMWLEMLEKGWMVGYVPKPNFRYRWHNKSQTYDLVNNHWAHMKSQLILNHPNLYPQAYIQWAALENKSYHQPLAVQETMSLLSLYCAGLPCWQNIYWWTEAKNKLCSLMQTPIDDQQLGRKLQKLKEIIDFNIKAKTNGDLKTEEFGAKDILVSAIVSAYNSKQFIRGCLEGLINQTIFKMGNLEIVVVNSGSEQNEGAVVRQFQQQYDNIKYIKIEKRETIYKSWNRGAQAASGKYLVNTNTDDRLRQDALEIMADTLEANEHIGAIYIDQIVTNYPNETFEKHHTNGFIERPDFSKEVIVQRNPCGPQVMWRKKLHELIGYFKPHYEVAGDWDFWLRIVFDTDYKITHIPELLGLYYKNPQGLEIGPRKQRERLKEIGEIRNKYGRVFLAQGVDNKHNCIKSEELHDKETTYLPRHTPGSDFKKSRRILLTTSAAPTQSPFSTSEKKPPIGIGFLISVLRNGGHEVFFIDNYLQPTDFLETDCLWRNQIDFVGIYANTICFRDTLRMMHKLEHLRQTGKWKGRIIVGGPHTTVAVHTIPDFVDYVVQGEGERAILDIVEGKVTQRIVSYPRIENLDELPMPAWHYFVELPYNWGMNFLPETPVFTMNTSRGCPFKCEFCSVGSIWGKKYTFFSAERIVADIEYLIKHYGVKGVYFREDNFTLNKERLKKFCNLIIEKGIKVSWACESRVSNLDRDIIELMSRAGLKGFYFGVESGSQRMLNLLQKGITVEQIRNAFCWCHEFGVKAIASTIVGVPGETQSDRQETKQLLKEINPDTTWFNVFVGIPNSKLYRFALDNKLYEYIDDRGLVYLQGHNDRAQRHYKGGFNACIPFEDENKDITNKPKISVLISVHNTEQFIEEALKSIYSQTYQDFEVVIVDDCSTDRTSEILLNLKDSRTFIYRNPENLGLTKSLNIGLKLCRGQYVARMDADDISHPQRFERQVKFLDENPDCLVLGCWYGRIDSDGKIWGSKEPPTEYEDTKKQLLIEACVGHGTAMVRRAALVEVGGFNEEYTYAQDYDLWLRLSEVGLIRNLGEYLYLLRSWPGNISTVKLKEQTEFAELAIRQALQRRYGNGPIDREVSYGFVKRAITWFNLREYINCINTLINTQKMAPNITKRFKGYDLLLALAYFAIGRERQCLTCLKREIQNHNNPAAGKFLSDYFEKNLRMDVQNWRSQNSRHYNLQLVDLENENCQQRQNNNISEPYVSKQQSEQKGIQQSSCCKRSEPLVSVIIPAYNAQKFITEAIQSVLSQTYRNFELVVVDDGSTDGTKDKVFSFKDERIKYFYHENSGLAATHNTGIKNSKGLFLVKLDSDDMMTADFIAAHLAEFEKHPDVDLVYCDDCLIEENSNPIRVIERPEYTDRRLLIRDLFHCGFPVVPFRTCIRRSVFDKIGFLDEELLVGEDYDMMRRFLKHGLKIHHLKSALYLRRMTSDSLSRNCSAQKAKCHFDVIKRYIDTFTYDELFPDVAWNEIAPQMRQLHAKCLAAGTYLAIGKEYVKTNATECSRTAFDRACSELNDCVKMNPENQSLRQLLQKSELIRARYTVAPQQVVS